MEDTAVEHVVVDAGGFIRNAPIREIGKEVYSAPEVVSEIRDKATKQRLQVLPYTLKLQSPSSEAIVFVSDFAKKTGDYRHLSSTDINVLALTYMLEKQHVGDEHIKKEPVKKQAEYVFPAKVNSQQMPGFFLGSSAKSPNEDSDSQQHGAEEAVEQREEEKGKRDEESQPSADIVVDQAEEDSIVDQAGQEREEEEGKKDEASADIAVSPENGVDGEKEKEDILVDDILPESMLEEEEIEEEEEDDDDDDDGGWITPSNIGKVKRDMGLGTVSGDQKRVSVACLTTDFAMQNVLIQMGLNVVSMEGMLIKQARSYVLRCFTCTKITYNTSKVFCPVCGNKTLKRVAMMRDEEGKVHFYFSRRPINTRGMKFAMPMPKGGKYSNNPLVCEDQPLPHQRPRRMKKTLDVFDPDYVAGASPFAMNDVNSRAASIGVSNSHDFRKSAVWNQRNPNESRRHGRKKKR